jgi:hypothetical protein
VRDDQPELTTKTTRSQGEQLMKLVRSGDCQNRVNEQLLVEEKPMPQNVRIFWTGSLLDGWVSGTAVVFEDPHMRPIVMARGESVLEAIHRVFGKCQVEVF